MPFPNGFLKETMFIEEPPCFINPSLPSHACHLTRALYGLKQAPRAWFERLTMYLLELGFLCNKVDSSLFVFMSLYGVLLMLMHVDDIIVTGCNSSIINCLIHLLGKNFL